MDQSFLKNIRVLLVDDDEDDALIIKKLFFGNHSSQFTFDWESEYDTAIDRIRQNDHDVYLIDYRLGGRTGLDLLEDLDVVDRPEPFILLTGVGDERIEFQSLKFAAADFLVKQSLSSNALVRAIYYALGRKEVERAKINQLIDITRSKDEFISIASHQLRTPATAVKQYVGMALDGMAGELSEAQRKLLKRAYENNERQLAIVNDLLKVAQVDAGGVELVYDIVELRDFIQKAVNDNKSLFDFRKQQLEVDFTGVKSDREIRLDESAIRMILDNVLENASKYSAPHTKTTVRITETTKCIVIAVEDEGVGVTDESRLFQKFSRINNELSTSVGGTGLGLYWAKSITKLHGGELLYEKNIPKGSKFILSIPKKL